MALFPLSDIVKRCDTSATSLLVNEQAEEVHWLLFPVNRHV